MDTKVPHPNADPEVPRREPAAPTQQEAEETLGRVLSSTAFGRSVRLRRFLAFIVAEHIADRADRLKEYALAVEVFDRGEEFDPRIDTIVRVEAGRLRTMLREYYADEARKDPVMIEVPKGAYSPAFRFLASPTSEVSSASAGLALDPRTIVVLPFDDMSAGRDQEFFCDGITEEITTALAHIDGLNVISRTSAFAFKGVATDVRTIGEKLDAGVALEGSVRPSGDRLRITAQLISTDNGHHLWAQRFDVESADILDVQDKVTAAIVERLREQMATTGEGGLGSIARRHSKNVEAYKRYLQGRFFANRHSRDDLEKAIDCYRQAIELDPGYGLPHAAKGEAHMEAALLGWMTPSEAMPLAQVEAEKALEIDETLPEGHSVLAAVLFRYHFDWQRAADEYRRALELRPGHGTLRNWYASFLLFQGQRDRAIFESRAAMALDPLSLEACQVLAGILFFCGQFDEAIEVCDRAHELDPDYFFGFFFRGLAHGGKGLFDLAVRDLEAASSVSSGVPLGRGALGWAYGRSGREDDARDIALELANERSEGRLVGYAIAMVHLGLGDADQAFEWLETAYEEKDGRVLLISASPIWDSLREDPRFASLLARMGLA